MICSLPLLISVPTSPVSLGMHWTCHALHLSIVVILYILLLMVVSKEEKDLVFEKEGY